VLEMENVLKFRYWEQGKKINFGRLLSFISEVRGFQKILECGKVFPSAYLGTYSKHRDKNYVLVVDMVKQIFPVYENRPVVHAQIIMGRNQAIVRIRDYNDKNRIVQELVWDSDEKIVKVVMGLLDVFKTAGIIPIITPDRYFGEYLVEYQTSFDDTFEMLDDNDLDDVSQFVAVHGFDSNGTGFGKQFGGFTVNLSHKNIYKDCIVSLTDNNDSSNVHWAIKREKLDQFMIGLAAIFEIWEEKKNKSD